MAITFALVEATPDRLMYLCTQDGVISSPPVDADGQATLPNDGGVTPDLQTDALSVAAQANPDFDISGIPILGPINANRNGYGPFAAGSITTGRAAALFGPDDSTNLLGNQNVAPCKVDIRPRTGAILWSVVAAVDGQNDPVLLVQSAVGAAATAYLTIHYLVTRDQ